ncbi:MAG: ElyC/SanA/YdcF family protein [Chitinophagales bacterium]|nr:ElyC/SanA/YdcF family protein [Chitinophagales bacterium]
MVRRFLFLSVICLSFVLGFALLGYFYVASATNKDIYSDMGNIHQHDVALVLGTSKRLKNGSSNPYFYTRVQAAATLYKNGKVKKILVSGDNGHVTYNEPKDMLNALIALGVCREDIVMDHAGFRTFDSMVRAKEVFGQQSLIVVSQRFQLQRALFIASAKNMKVVGFEAEDPQLSGNFLFAREILARTKALMDCYLLNTAPRYLGQKEEIRVNS